MIKVLAKEMKVSEAKIEVVLELLKDNTVPFIARYRKEMTGGLDEVQIVHIKERFDYHEKLEERKKFVEGKIEEQGKLTGKLRKQIENVKTLQEIEDIYVPYKVKKNTKAQKAKEKGIDGYVEKLKKGSKKDVKRWAKDKNISEEEMEDGIKEILKEEVFENIEVKSSVRNVYKETSTLQVTLKEGEGNEKYASLDGLKEDVKNVPSHRWLAVQRGVKEGFLKADIVVDKETVKVVMEKSWKDGEKIKEKEWVDEVIQETFTKKLKPSVEREIKKDKGIDSDDKAIGVFQENVESLLLQSPLKGKNVLALDPAYRTGCKLAVIGSNGEFRGKGLIYPHAPQKKWKEAQLVLLDLMERYEIDVVAIGNGTASRESEMLVNEVIRELDRSVGYVIVNEDGASVYSASAVARKEFPDLQVEERSAVSIGRRLQDPLAELVKIDPRSLGVGQYQHDVDEKKLSKSLDFTIEKVVNRVGVDVNTASVELLTYVAGLNEKTAQNIVDYRTENGPFTDRKHLKKVKGIGNKAYEQAVGFLRIYGGKNALDETGIHPEQYERAEKFLDKAERETLLETGFTVAEGSTDWDIVQELEKPGRDIREELGDVFVRESMVTEEDVKEGMHFKGVVRNVVDFGAFVDIGLKNDGLVHISKLADRFVKHPKDVVKVGDQVDVWIESFEQEKGKIGLRMVNGYK